LAPCLAPITLLAELILQPRPLVSSLLARSVIYFRRIGTQVILSGVGTTFSSRRAGPQRLFA
jgi:hypothetical protein